MGLGLTREKALSILKLAKENDLTLDKLDNALNSFGGFHLFYSPLSFKGARYIRKVNTQHKLAALAHQFLYEEIAKKEFAKKKMQFKLYWIILERLIFPLPL